MVLPISPRPRNRPETARTGSLFQPPPSCACTECGSSIVGGTPNAHWNIQWIYRGNPYYRDKPHIVGINGQTQWKSLFPQNLKEIRWIFTEKTTRSNILKPLHTTSICVKNLECSFPRRLLDTWTRTTKLPREMWRSPPDRQINALWPRSPSICHPSPSAGSWFCVYSQGMFVTKSPGYATRPFNDWPPYNWD